LEPDKTLATKQLEGKINTNSLGVVYRANGKAWMTAVLFQE
ncbi:9076_t:CDS:2, partial [Entrophospora sp. SA101]